MSRASEYVIRVSSLFLPRNSPSKTYAGRETCSPVSDSPVCPRASGVANLLVSSIKREVKKKHICNGWTFSCFAAHLKEQDLF